MLRVLVTLGVVAVAVLGLLWGLQRHLVYFPDAGPLPRAAQVLPGARDLTLSTEDGLHLGAWLVPPTGTDRRIAVLVTNGNAGNRAARAPLARALADQGLTVLLFDYRGYGGNPGRPSEDGLARDAATARSALLTETGVSPDQLIYYGESLGAAVAARLAVEHPPGGLVLRSPFVDLAAVARVHYPLLPARWLLRDRFPVVEYVARVDVPTVVVLGSRDDIVPAEQSRRVARAAAGPTRLVEVEGAGHNDPALLHGPELVGAVADLADHLAQ
jgi:pimeloyl-ACP methyl ester carboxylesterase